MDRTSKTKTQKTNPYTVLGVERRASLGRLNGRISSLFGNIRRKNNRKNFKRSEMLMSN